MTTAELLDKYAELADVWGWPEWTDESDLMAPTRWRLTMVNGRPCKQWWEPGRQRWSLEWNSIILPPYEALCIWQRHVGVWCLMERGGYRAEAVEPCDDLERRWTVTIPLTTVWTEFHGATLGEAQLAAGRGIREHGDGGETATVL